MKTRGGRRACPERSEGTETSAVLTVQEQLAALRDAYARSLPEKLERIALAWQAIRTNSQGSPTSTEYQVPSTGFAPALGTRYSVLGTRGRAEDDRSTQPYREEALETLHRGAHSLAGSGASMGFAALSVTARELEIYVQGLVEGRKGTEPSPSEIEEVDLLIDALRRAAQNERTEGTSGQWAVDSGQRPVGSGRWAVGSDQGSERPEAREAGDGPVTAHRTPHTAHRPLPTGPQFKEDGAKVVFLLEKDTELAQDLAAQIGYFGYEMRVFDRWGEIEQALGQITPIAVIADIAALQSPMPTPIPEGPEPARRTIVRGQFAPKGYPLIRGPLRGGTPLIGDGPRSLAQCPLIFISEHDEISARLQAVRMGGAAYFKKPVAVDSIVSKLDELTSPQASDPFRILVIDDEPELAGFHASILESAGMLTMVISDPMLALTALLESKPDLILMDMHMPGCTGVELAGVIRQQEAYVSVPIVYLSAETDVDKQLAAMRLGGDSFLTKPIRPEHLISAVRGRVERLRVLRSFMVRDSLTGLLNHTVIKEQLALEVARTMRVNKGDQGVDLCFALVDIDHFKLVNDTYGHPTGDRVIKSISRLLQQRLRKSDMVGRYGGEEFAIILPNTGEVGAVKLLDELRNGFAQVRHRSEGREFYVTFSAGVAQFSAQFTDASQLSSAADRALYEAKAQGRNCVAVASSN